IFSCQPGGDKELLCFILLFARLPRRGAFSRSHWSAGNFGGDMTSRFRLFTSVALHPFYGTGVDAFEQHEQIAAFDLDWLVFAVDESHVGKPKYSDFEPLREDGEAVEVPPEYFDEVAATAAEQKQRSRERVLMNH